MAVDAPSLHLDNPAHYRICIQGLFDACWLELLSGVWLITERQSVGQRFTTLVGQVADQAALVGDIEQLYSLGLPILAVECLLKQDAANATVASESER
jgi:hypothetical protein